MTNSDASASLDGPVPSAAVAPVAPRFVLRQPITSGFFPLKLPLLEGFNSTRTIELADYEKAIRFLLFMEPIMSIISRRIILLSSAALAGAAFLGPAQADDLKITIGYQTVVEPSKVPQADGAYEKATRRADRLAEIRFRRRRDRRDRLRLARYRLCRLEPAGGRGQPRAADRDHLRRRPDRRIRGAGRPQRRRHRRRSPTSPARRWPCPSSRPRITACSPR